MDKLYAFGPFVADPVTGTLRQDGAHVVLTLKSFEVLMVLIERRGQVVDKDVLLKLVWPDTIVEENNLARHISTLRKAAQRSSSRLPVHCHGPRPGLPLRRRETRISLRAA